MASPELAAAVASLLNGDQERILSLASSLRAPNRTIESTVKGTSMGSVLPPGSRILIDMSPRGEWPVGEVVAFVGGDQVVVHRVVHLGRNHVLTRGDARLAPDTPLKPEQILGPVSAVAGEGGWVPLPPQASRSPLARAAAAAALLVAKVLLLSVGPGITGATMRMFHALEGRAHLAAGRLLSSGR
jgi:hypothetical protein